MTTDDAVLQLGSSALLAEDVVVWGLPLVMMSRYLAAAVEADVPFNRFFMNDAIATPRSDAVGPNIDTLNGRAWLDLDAGPVVIGVPEIVDRYYSVQLQDLYMNSFAYIGTRTTGTRAGAFAITPPGYDGTLPENVTEIRATTSKIMAFVRTLVRGQKDQASVAAINGGFTIGSLADYPNDLHAATIAAGALDAFQPASRRLSRVLPHQEIAEAGAAFFEELDACVVQFPPLPDDAAHRARFGSLRMFRKAMSDDALAAVVRSGIAKAQHALVTRSSNGWSRRDNVMPFIADPLQRAANNIYGPNTQIAAESIFFNKRQGPDGLPLSGANRYRLFFPGGQLPPVDAFWSLSLYDNAYALFDNPLDRYGITDRTEGLRYALDGSLDIRVQVEPPDDPLHNWLPSPREGFQLILRTYQPRLAILDESYLPPPLEIVGAD